MKEKSKPKVKKKRKLRPGFIVALLVVVLAVFTILSTTVLLPINNISVEYSGKKYTGEEILAVSGVDKEDNILMTLESVVNKKVTEGLPYIGAVELKKELPDKVTLIARETKAAYCLKYNKKYVILDSEFKVLETASKKKSKLTYLKGLKLSGCEIGKFAEFKSETAFSNVKQILKMVKKSGNSINNLDITSQFDISLMVNGKYTVEIGKSNDLTEKLEFMNKMIEQIEKKHKNDKGTINLRYFTEKKEGYFTRGDAEEIYS